MGEAAVRKRYALASIVAWLIGVALFVGACVTPVYTTDSETVRGWSTLFFGPLALTGCAGPPWAIVPWLGNACVVFGALLLALVPNRAITAGRVTQGLGLIIAPLALALPGRAWVMGNVATSSHVWIRGIGPGTYLWLTSLWVLVAGTELARSARTPAPPLSRTGGTAPGAALGHAPFRARPQGVFEQPPPPDARGDD